MSASTSSSYNTLLQLQGIYSARRLLLHSPSQQTPTATVAASATATPPPSYVQSESYSPGDNSFDSNVVMVLSVLLCALICSLGLNSIIRCALRCSSLVASDAGGTGQSTRLANTGVKRKALKTFPVMSYSAELKYPGLDAECIICLSEFVPGEKVRILPKCQHGFHVRCIDKWLSSHSSCPTCRHCLIETCQKIMGCSSSGGSSQVTQSEMVPVQPQQPVQVIMAPLEPEGPIRDYHGVS